MVVSRVKGQVFMTVRGPERQASIAECPPDGEWIGIHFKVGTFMPQLPNLALRDRKDATLPDVSGRSFWLAGSAWEYPSFENADVFVRRLQKQGLISSDPHVRSALEHPPRSTSRRTEQRHFLRASGITQATARQSERARRATYLLQTGVPILQVLHDMGYFDQSHLTRSLQHFVGRTPAQVARGEGQLSAASVDSKAGLTASSQDAPLAWFRRSEA
jgi:AraC-like DNA-binding protein